MTHIPHFFATDKQSRDARCSAKDAIVADVIARLSIPSDFAAVLMPAAHGPEVGWLAERGVSLDRMFAIERHAPIRQAQIKRGLRVPFKAMPANEAVDQIPFDHVDFCYLDFLGRPSTGHLETIRKLMKLDLLRPGSCLLVTLGVNRGDRFSSPMLSRDHEVMGDAYLRAAVQWARGMQPRKVQSHQYASQTGKHVARFITTEMWF